MKKLSTKKSIYLFLVAACLLWLVIACWAIITQKQGSAVDPIYPNVHGNYFANDAYFQSFDGNISTSHMYVRGAILPRLQLNAAALAETMATIRQNKHGQTVVVICFGRDVGPAVLSGDWYWQTAYGVTQVDLKLQEQMVWAGLALDNERLAQSEDLGRLMAYCGFYLPDTKVIPLLIDETMSDESMTAALADLLPQENCTVLVMPPAGEHYDLPVDTVRELAALLADARHNDLSPYVGRQNARALRVLTAALPSGEELTSLRYSESEGGHRFADLLIFYGERR